MHSPSSPAHLLRRGRRIASASLLAGLLGALALPAHATSGRAGRAQLRRLEREKAARAAYASILKLAFGDAPPAHLVGGREVEHVIRRLARFSSVQARQADQNNFVVEAGDGKTMVARLFKPYRELNLESRSADGSQTRRKIYDGGVTTLHSYTVGDTPSGIDRAHGFVTGDRVTIETIRAHGRSSGQRYVKQRSILRKLVPALSGQAQPVTVQQLAERLGMSIEDTRAAVARAVDLGLASVRGGAVSATHRGRVEFPAE